MKISYTEATHWLDGERVASNHSLRGEFTVRAKSRKGILEAMRKQALKSYDSWAGFYEKHPHAIKMDGDPKSKVYEFVCSCEINGRRLIYHLFVPFCNPGESHEALWDESDGWGNWAAYRLQRSYPQALLEGRIITAA